MTIIPQLNGVFAGSHRGPTRINYNLTKASFLKKDTQSQRQKPGKVVEIAKSLILLVTDVLLLLLVRTSRFYEILIIYLFYISVVNEDGLGEQREDPLPMP